MTDPESELRACILDYLNKRGFSSAATGMRRDVLNKLGSDIPTPEVESPDGFLVEYFSLFWDVWTQQIQRQRQQQQQRNKQLQQQQQLKQVSLQQQQQSHSQTTSQQQSHQHFNNKQIKQQQQLRQLQRQPQQKFSQGTRPDNLDFSDPSNPQIHLNQAAITSTPGSNSLPVSRQNLFPNVDQNQSRQQQPTSHPLMNQDAFRPASSNVALQQLQLQPDPQLLIQNRRSIQPSSTTDNRSRANPMDNRRGINQSQRHSLASQDQLSNPTVTNDLIDINNPLFPAVASRNTNNRNPSSNSIIGPNGRNSMSQIQNRNQSQNQQVANSMRISQMNGPKNRQYNGVPTIPSDAPSSASRQGNNDINMNVNRTRQYKNVVEDESQPRNGLANANQNKKKRQADQIASQKNSSSPPGNLSPHQPFNVSNENNVSAKRQRSSTSFPPNMQISPQVQQQGPHQFLSLELDQMSQFRNSHPQGRARNHQQQLHALHQRSQGFPPSIDGVNTSSFMDQPTGQEKLIGNGVRYTNPAFSQKARQLTSQLQGRRIPSQNPTNPDGTDPMLANDGKRDPRNFRITDDGFNITQSPMQNGTDFGDMQNSVQRQMNADASYFAPRNQWDVYSQITNQESLNATLAQSQSNLKKASSGRVSVPRNRNNDVLDRLPAENNEKGIGEVSGVDISRRKEQLLERSAFKEDRGEQSMRQGYKRDDLQKHSGKEPTNQELTLNVTGKSKGTEMASTGNGKQNQTNEKSKTEGSSDQHDFQDTGFETTKSKSMRLPGSTSAAQQAMPILTGQGNKRDKGSTEGESRSTKSERQLIGGRGGGTASQKSTASGGSAAVEKRNGHGSSSTTGRRSRGRSRGRGGGTGRRSKADRGPPRGSNSARASASQNARGNGPDQKVTSSASLQIPEPRQGEVQHNSPHLQGNLVHINTTGSKNTGMKNRQIPKSNTDSGRQPVNRHVHKNKEAPNLFDLPVDNTMNDQAAELSLDRQQRNVPLDTDSNSLFHAGMEGVGKMFMNPMGSVPGHGNGKTNNAPANNYPLDMQYLPSGADDDADFSKIFSSIDDPIQGLEGASDYGSEMLGVDNPSIN